MRYLKYYKEAEQNFVQLTFYTIVLNKLFVNKHIYYALERWSLAHTDVVPKRTRHDTPLTNFG